MQLRVMGVCPVLDPHLKSSCSCLPASVLQKVSIVHCNQCGTTLQPDLAEAPACSCETLRSRGCSHACLLRNRANPVLNFELGGIGINPFEVNTAYAHGAPWTGCSSAC